MLYLLKHFSCQPAEQEDTGTIAPGDSVECSWSYVLSGFVDKSWAQQAQPAHGSVWRPKNEFEVALAYRSWIPMVCSDRGVTLVLILRGFFWGSKELRWVLHISRPSTCNSPPSLRCWVRLYCWGLRAIGLLFSNQDWLLGPWVESTHVASGTGVHQFLILQWFPRIRNHKQTQFSMTVRPSPLSNPREGRIEGLKLSLGSRTLCLHPDCP